MHLGCSHGAAGFEKLVAIKVLKSELTRDPEQAKYLREEAHIGVGLEHQNIVQIYDLGHEADSYFVVMEYIRGFSLAKTLAYLSKGGERIPVAVSAHIFRGLASALDYVHAQEAPDGGPPLCHGDVSAANVMVSSTGRIALADFGVAAFLRHRPEQLAGKWSYVPPEALLGARVDRSWDLFALGALFYEMVSGRKAFPSTSFATRSQADEISTPLSSLRDDLPAGLSEVVARFITPTVSERYPSAREMRRALDSVLPPSGDDEAELCEFFDALYQRPGFKEEHGELPSTSSIRGALDPFMEETETPTINVRVSKPLRFGLSLAHGAERAKGYGELLGTVLTESIQRPVRPVLLGDYQTLLDCLLEGDIDIAWMPPLLMAEAVARSAAGVIAIAERNGTVTYHGALFTRADSQIQSVSELRGRSIGWVDAASASGYHFPRHLIERHLGPVQEALGRESFFGSHQAVCEAVANGWVDVGASYVVTDDSRQVTSSGWSELLPERQHELRLLEMSLPIPSDCIAHRPHFSEQWKQDVEKAFIGLHRSPAGLELLSQAFGAERFASGTILPYEGIKDVL